MRVDILDKLQLDLYFTDAPIIKNTIEEADNTSLNLSDKTIFWKRLVKEIDE